ncbi:MAG: hypothetical protein COY81_03910 [Candidatus Pacebacteria bacterium CG_4_10_14_0_8_um_filter_43_12]|nr:MAG: hypothetical protein COY81_03910 [Candidatus Pacebacteria bacterium CG_4_10_14_0_8_um_filter_43_12]
MSGKDRERRPFMGQCTFGIDEVITERAVQRTAASAQKVEAEPKDQEPFLVMIPGMLAEVNTPAMKRP